MAANPPEAYSDDFLNQILAIPSYGDPGAIDAGAIPTTGPPLSSPAAGGSGYQPSFVPLRLSLDNGREDVDGGAFARKSDRESTRMASLFPEVEHLQPQSVDESVPQIQQVLHGQPISSATVTVPYQLAVCPKVRARRGQATDPHSIAERLRRERIAERIKALQELVPTCNKTDRAVMLDEILDYVKFLRLQVKVLSMSRLGGAGAVTQLVADNPRSLIEGDYCEDGCNQHPWAEWSDQGIEQEVAKLMEEDVEAAMQYLQSKALCLMPVSLAALIYSPHQRNAAPTKPDLNDLSMS
ncbi:hypothetical protein NMG60_11032067 [Bertholletia excelsa]